jgi:hypothetical protein
MKIYYYRSDDQKPHGFFYENQQSSYSDFSPRIEILLPDGKKTIETYIILLHEIGHYYQSLSGELPHGYTKKVFLGELIAWRIAKAMIKPKYYDLLDVMAIPRLRNYAYECSVNLKRKLKIMPLHYRIKKSKAQFGHVL